MYIGHEYNELSDPWCGGHISSVCPTSTLSAVPQCICNNPEILHWLNYKKYKTSVMLVLVSGGTNNMWNVELLSF
jgi:hypothetical protein